MCCRYLTDNTAGVLVYSKTTITLRDEITGGSNKQILVTTIVIESLWDEVNELKSTEIQKLLLPVKSKIGRF
jgi:hypothetical protein